MASVSLLMRTLPKYTALEPVSGLGFLTLDTTMMPQSHDEHGTEGRTDALVARDFRRQLKGSKSVAPAFHHSVQPDLGAANDSFGSVSPLGPGKEAD